MKKLEEPVQVKQITRALTPRAQRSRDNLVDAARIVFERDGFHDARITDITTTAGVSHGTFYTYFESKEAVFLALVHQVTDDALTPLHAAPLKSMTHFERLRHNNREYFKMYREYGRIIALWEDVTSVNAEAAELLESGLSGFSDRSELLIRRLQDSGLADQRINPRYAAAALTGMIHRFAYRWFSQGRQDSFDFDTAVDQISLIWANAIGLDSSPSS